MVKIFERRETPDGWLYDDKDEHSFVVRSLFHGFNLAEFDSWLEEHGWPEENLKLLRHRRALAFDSFRRNDGGMMLERLEYLANVMRNAIRHDRILPLARSGEKTKIANTLNSLGSRTHDALSALIERAVKAPGPKKTAYDMARDFARFDDDKILRPHSMWGGMYLNERLTADKDFLTGDSTKFFVHWIDGDKPEKTDAAGIRARIRTAKSKIST